MKKIADAADPLYKTLDDGQKRRLVVPDPYGRPVRRRLAPPWFRARHDGRRPGSRLRPGWRPERPRAAVTGPTLYRPKDKESRRIPAAFPIFRAPDKAGKTSQACWTSRGRFAKRRPLAKAFRAGSGRIAQLVEQMTLNHRVPGSSPGAPTKLFKNLAVPPTRKSAAAAQLSRSA